MHVSPDFQPKNEKMPLLFSVTLSRSGSSAPADPASSAPADPASAVPVAEGEIAPGASSAKEVGDVAPLWTSLTSIASLARGDTGVLPAILLAMGEAGALFKWQGRSRCGEGAVCGKVPLVCGGDVPTTRV